MKITGYRLGILEVPLVTPFKTALRSVDSVRDVIVELQTDDGAVGYGEAPPTAAVTGETTGSILEALRGCILPTLVGRPVEDLNGAMQALDRSIVHNTSAKAAADIALYDLYGKLLGVPVRQLFGGGRQSITTDITISVNDPQEMAADAVAAVQRGFRTLKTKVGSDAALDVQRLVAVRSAVGSDICIRVDANQAWSPKQAIRLIEQMQSSGADLELVEQPVPAGDIEGLAYVTAHSPVPILADESAFSPLDALRIMQMRAADMVNIKLMKCGGLHNALRIVSAAETYGVACMIGSMLEAKVSVNAAVQLACAKSIISKVDLDGPSLCRFDPVEGGCTFDGPQITVQDAPGLGVRRIDGLRYFS